MQSQIAVGINYRLIFVDLIDQLPLLIDSKFVDFIDCMYSWNDKIYLW